MGSTITIEISDRIATITLNRPASLNAITTEGTRIFSITKFILIFMASPTGVCCISYIDYDAFANALREIDKNEDVLVTVWQGARLSHFNSSITNKHSPSS